VTLPARYPHKRGREASEAAPLAARILVNRLNDIEHAGAEVVLVLSEGGIHKDHRLANIVAPGFLSVRNELRCPFRSGQDDLAQILPLFTRD
jgi:hypothetical protein